MELSNGHRCGNKQNVIRRNVPTPNRSSLQVFSIGVLSCEGVMRLDLGDQNCILSECFFVCCCDCLKLGHVVLDLVVLDFNVENFGLFKLTLRFDLAGYVGAVLKVWHVI